MTKQIRGYAFLKQQDVQNRDVPQIGNYAMNTKYIEMQECKMQTKQ